MIEDFKQMTPELRAYLDHDPAAEEGGYEKGRALRKLVQPDVLRAYFRREKEAKFAPGNEKDGSRQEHASASGRYKLVTSSFATSPGCWSYTQGRVYGSGSDEPIAVVNRNYSAFPFEFVEGHPNGHDYLVCGEDYQGQTVVELDTGRRRDFLPEEAEDGAGFCWADYEFHPATKLLLVCGCHWACPYEYRLYDFSNPMEGWPLLESDEWIDADARKPSFEEDGTIKAYQTESSDEDEGCEKAAVAAVKTFRREENKLVLVSEDVMPAEQERRRKSEEARKAYEDWLAEFKSTDPLYVTSLELMKDPLFKPEDHMSIGQTYDGWCPHWKGQEKRICRRIANGYSKGYTIDLEIAHLTGPVKLVVYKDGKTVGDEWFEHSVDGVERAFARSKSLLSEAI